MVLESLLEECVAEDRLLGLSMTSLLKMKGDRVAPYAADIRGFLEHRAIPNPLRRYTERMRELSDLQQRFDRTGRYPASCYADVESIDLEQYNLALLLSFVVTIHRFEILQHLVDFLDAPCPGPHRFLSVGYGTGYELKLALEQLSGWEMDAFERSHEVAAYAEDLLRYFECRTDCLHLQEFPLEHGDVGPYEGRYGKVVLCEILEHLERPEEALSNTRLVLHPEGRAFLTMAVNIAQEDHIFLYRSPEQARRQVEAAGLTVHQEWIAPVSALPFADKDRATVFRRGNYICVAGR
jgi:SAM-dependent methyltransferase